MTPTQRLLWQRVQRRAATLSPELRASLLRAFRDLGDALTETELAALLRENAVDDLLDALFSDARVDDAFAAFRDRLRAGLATASRSVARDLPPAARGIAFNILNPSIVEAVRTLETRVIQGLTDDLRSAVRAYVEAGIREGVGPRAIARDLRPLLGLAPNQLDAVTNFRRMLETGDRQALTRALRNRRFDGTLRRALGTGLTPEQIDRMTAAYRRRMVAFNAETHARTAALDAQRLGQHLTWQAAVERGDVDGGRLMKRWSGTLDDRERDSHLLMEGETVGWDERFSNGEMLPGDSTFNCRCVPIYFTARDAAAARRFGAGARGVSVEQLRGVGRRLRVA